jgi:hypothetical protein
MSQYRSGTFTSAGTAVTLPLGFIPNFVRVLNLTVLQGTPPNSASPAESFWVNSMPKGSASQTIYTAGLPAQSYIATNGVTPVVLGGDWQNTQYVISAVSKSNPGVVTVTGISPANTMTLVNGMIVTISNVKGMTQLNTNRYVVAQLTISGIGPAYTFALYDLFGNPVDTTGFGTYVNVVKEPAIVNQISYPPIGPVLDPTTGQVITQAQPAGNQYDIGFMGIILGTGLVGASTNVIYWDAITQTPTGW